MIITREELERDIKELFWRTIQYSWLNKSIANDDNNAIKICLQNSIMPITYCGILIDLVKMVISVFQMICLPK